MCWSAEASGLFATIGTAGSIFEYRKRPKNKPFDILEKHTIRTGLITYFTLMEFIQLLNYYTLSTTSYLNSFSALLAYLHIAIQPFFFVLFPFSLIPYCRRKFWFKYLLIFSSLTTLLMLSRLVVSPKLTACFSHLCTPVTNIASVFNLNELLTKTVGCSQTQFLSYKGHLHIAWTWILNACHHYAASYTLCVFVFPIFFGAYRAVLYCALTGPIMSTYLTYDPNEWAAIWCLLSVGIIVSLNIKPIERLLTVNALSWKQSLNKLALIVGINSR